MLIQQSKYNNCTKITEIDTALEIMQNTSTVIFDMFYKNVGYVDWLATYYNLPYTKENTIYSEYKNGNINGEIVIDNERKCWYFARSSGWVMLPFSIGKYTFKKFAKAYFNNIDKFDKMFINYMQETLLNKYYID